MLNNNRNNPGSSYFIDQDIKLDFFRKKNLTYDTIYKQMLGTTLHNTKFMPKQLFN